MILNFQMQCQSHTMISHKRPQQEQEENIKNKNKRKENEMQ